MTWPEIEPRSPRTIGEYSTYLANEPVKLIIYIKMDLALNNLQKLICHKKPTNQPMYLYM